VISKSSIGRRVAPTSESQMAQHLTAAIAAP
jgi:hypothetical protein